MQLNETSSFDVWTRKWLRKCLSSTYMSISEASKAYRYFWSLVFWWKIKIEECLGPYLWTWSLKCFIQRFFYSCHVFLRFLTFFILLWTFFHLWLKSKPTTIVIFVKLHCDPFPFFYFPLQWFVQLFNNGAVTKHTAASLWQVTSWWHTTTITPTTTLQYMHLPFIPLFPKQNTMD